MSNDVSPPSSTTTTTPPSTVITEPTHEPPTSSSPVPSLKSPTLQRRRSSSTSRHSNLEVPANHDPEEDGDNAISDDGFGEDDFDDFGEVVEGEEFDDFEGFEEAEEVAPPVVAPPAPPVAPPLLVPVVDFEDVGDGEEVQRVLAESVGKMFPADDATPPTLPPASEKAFFTERSLSLWNQLVAPPPLQPTNWKLSRIRRLFLVSLGVPVDLDEILPPETKAKKLVLPSTLQPRSSSRQRTSTSRSRSKTGARPSAELGPEALDMPFARILCSVSDVALSGFTIEELREHVKKLEETTVVASEVLTYWLKKRESSMGDKETFETVIESLVGYARKKRQNG
ncbi:hypothetical protein RUND412_001213 [Rhizina undulata]